MGKKKHSFLVLGHRLSILMPQPTVKQVAASTHGQSAPRAPEEPCQAAHSGPWCTLDTKLPVAGTEIKDPEEKGQMLRLRNTRGLLRALCLDKNGMRRTQRRRQSYQSRDRACESLGKRGILHCLKVCLGRTEGGFMWMRQCCSGTVWCLVSRTKHAFSQKTKWGEIKLAASQSRRWNYYGL